MRKYQVVHAYFATDLLTDSGVIVLGEYKYLDQAMDALPEFRKEAISPLSMYRIRFKREGQYCLHSYGETV